MAPLPSIMATSSDATTVKIIFSMMKRILALTALTLTSSACAYPSITEIDSPPAVEVPIIQYELTWKCEDCTPE